MAGFYLAIALSLFLVVSTILFPGFSPTAAGNFVNSFVLMLMVQMYIFWLTTMAIALVPPVLLLFFVWKSKPVFERPKHKETANPKKPTAPKAKKGKL